MSVTTTGPFPLAELVDRAKTMPSNPFRQIEASPSRERLKAGAQNPPALFVIQGEERPGDRAASGTVYRQRMTTTVGFVIVARHYAPDISRGGAASIEALTRALRGRFLDWRAPSAITVFESAGGQPMTPIDGDEDGTLVWLDRMRCDYWLQ